jgi:LEA14-like dessication related protein
LAIAAIAGLVLAGCASLPENIISQPEVQLRDVKVVGLGFKNQTFLLSFDIHNPNPFPLPVNHVSYGVRLDGQRFASGQTQSDIAVPAGGDARFAISVELDLLTTAPQLLSIVGDGARAEVPYELDGKLGIDIPLTPPVTYRTRGTIRLNSTAH